MGRVKQLGEKTELSTTERGGTDCVGDLIVRDTAHVASTALKRNRRKKQ
jgi:hypothetical protein